MTVIVQPSGKMEEIFVLMSALKQEPPPAEIAMYLANHDMQVVGSPLSVD